MQGLSQDLRIDFNRINSEKAKQKTNGDYLNYLEKEVQKLVHLYGKTSKEYIYLQGFYLDEYAQIYQPYTTQNTISIKEYTEGRKELLELTGKVYGDTSWVYANAILADGMNYTGVWNQAISDSTFNALIALTDKAIDITTSTKAYNEETRYSNLSMLYAQKGDLFKKANLKDSAIKYYNIVLNLKEIHPLYDNFYPSFLTLYANMIDDEDEQKGLDFLIRYEPVIKEKYFQSGKEKYFSYLTSILNHYLRTNYIDKQTISYLMVADTLCMDLYGELSKEYVNYSLDFKLSAFKKMGWKSLVFQVLADLDTYVFKQKASLLTEDDNIFKKYYLEWFYYYQSINDEQKGITYLKWLEKHDIDSNLNRISFSSKILIFRELSNYYRFKNFDSCLNYSVKVLDLELKAQKLWGDYVVHQYAEIAKLMVNAVDTPNYELTNKFCVLAAIEFKEAYGLNSSFYKSAMFTHGKLLFKIGKKIEGLEQMAPMVYTNLHDNRFIPPLNTSIFQTYGDVLNQVNRYDSADYFYNQIYLRNNAAQVFRVLGTSEEYQLRAFQDIYTQNFLILTQHFQRFNVQGYKYISSELAENLFKKNLTYQIQSYINEAITNSTSENDKLIIKRIEKDKATYDSLLYSGSTDFNLLDSAYEGLDLDKNWLLQSYIVNNSKDSNKLEQLKREYSYTDIRNLLDGRECFIDIIRFLQNDKEYGFSPEPNYAIVLIDKMNTGRLEYFFINDGLGFESSVLDGKLDKVSKALAPLFSKLEKYSKIYVNPDGVFNLLNFYALKDQNDEYLIRNKTFVYINTINGVVEQEIKYQKNRSATFWGDPVFNTKEASKTNQRNTIFSKSALNNYKELPYSKIEIEAASEALEKKGWLTKKYLGNKCTEELLKREQPTDILHIATHGFYISETDSSKTNFAFKSNPYLKSGLVLGFFKNNGKDLNDNVLTAYEVMDLHLNNTSLVVLSACESAKGEIKPGQGIYGLQRAFKIAGAKNVLVSVKNVDDKATQLLMQYFYENIANGDTYVDALRKAQLRMTNHPLFNDPKYWSNFILIGQ